MARTKALRLRLGDPAGDGSEARRRVRADYDHLLVQVADLLALPGAPEPDLVIGRRVLTTLERSLLEKEVAATGVDIGIRHPPSRGLHRSHQTAPAQGAPAPTAPPAPAPSPPRTSSPAPAPEPPITPVSRRLQLATLAKSMRRRLDLYEADDRLWPTKVEEWCEDLDTYDNVLVDLAALSGLPAAALPEGNRRRLLSEERDALEDGLQRAGVELT